MGEGLLLIPSPPVGEGLLLIPSPLAGEEKGEGESTKRREAMNKLIGLTLGVVALALWALPLPAHAQLAEVNQAIKLLTDYPGKGGRATAYRSPDPEDFAKTWGADVGNIDQAAGLLQEALNKTTDPNAKAQLDLAVDYAKARLHKEARLSAQGALYYLCQAAGGSGEGCDKVPKFGSYVAP